MSDATKSLAERFGHAARSRHQTSQQKAHQYWRDLAPRLSDAQRRELRTAWSHHVDVAEGPEDLDRLVATLVERGL